jgi:serine/threonine protein kinase
MFALALTTYQLLRGVHPFRDEFGWNPDLQQAADWSDKLEDVTPEAKDFVMRCGACKSFQRPLVGVALAHPFIVRGKLSHENIQDHKTTQVENKALNGFERIEEASQQEQGAPFGMKFVFKSVL